MRISAKFTFILLAVVVFVGEISKDNGNKKIDPRTGIRESPFTPLPDMRPEGLGTIGPGRTSDREIVIAEEERKSRAEYTGTAFSIDNNGFWITARHVTNNCDQILIARPFQRPLPIEGVAEHIGSDVSLIKTSRGYPPLDVDYNLPIFNQEGFHYGFPRGKPGAVYSRLIGRRIMKTIGANNYKETVHVWAEKKRIPNSNESLGGISGGPILNKDGKVVGIHVAGSLRRGRSFSSLPSNINDLLNKYNININPAFKMVNTAELNTSDFSNVGNKLRDELTVAQVVCRTY